MEYPHKELTREIISAAIAVHEVLRPGLDEKLYERALCIEMGKRSMFFEQQPKHEVTYKGKFLGHLIPDLVVERKVIVDTKCVSTFDSAHEAQMLGYLNIPASMLRCSSISKPGRSARNVSSAKASPIILCDLCVPQCLCGSKSRTPTQP